MLYVHSCLSELLYEQVYVLYVQVLTNEYLTTFTLTCIHGTVTTGSIVRKYLKRTASEFLEYIEEMYPYYKVITAPASNNMLDCVARHKYNMHWRRNGGGWFGPFFGSCI